MRIQQIWASIIGSATLLIGTLRFFIPVLNTNIPLLDGIIHIVTGGCFITGAWAQNGQYVSRVNRWIGFFYVLFGANGNSYPHMIVGLISILMSMIPNTPKRDLI